MRTTRLLVPLFALALVTPLQAQQWSPEEQSVLDDLAECWDFWMDGVRSGQADLWIDECTVPGATFWPANDGAPFGTDFVRRNWTTISGRDLGWVDIRPVLMRIHDDIAVLHFYGYWSAGSDAGPVVTEARRTEVFRRIDGRWRILSGHGTPVTAEDAEPYRRGGR